MKRCFLLLLFIISLQTGYSQFGYGLTVTNDVYHWYKNPTNSGGGSAGSVLANLGVGPKIWVGNRNFSVSAEAQAVWGIFTMSINEYAGLGSISYPMMVKLNFQGLSTYDNELRPGFSIGGGVQYTRTEWYASSKSLAKKGLKRELYRTFIAQAGYGFGINGVSAVGFVRYGLEPDIKAHTLNIGVQYNFNMPRLKYITPPESEL